MSLQPGGQTVSFLKVILCLDNKIDLSAKFPVLPDTAGAPKRFLFLKSPLSHAGKRPSRRGRSKGDKTGTLTFCKVHTAKLVQSVKQEKKFQWPRPALELPGVNLTHKQSQGQTAIPT